jgi:hypothetical protein
VRHRLQLASIAVVITAVAAAGVVLAGRGEDGGPASGEAADDTVPDERGTAPVRRHDLARTEELDGTVGRGPAKPVVLATEGTLTAVPEVGAVVEAGDTIAEVDGQPVVVLPGRTPLWRELGPGVDDGRDVLAVEYVLAALGYAQPHDVTVDEDWTSATTDAVEDFQTAHGMDDDGALSPGEVVFIDGTVRVAGVEGAPGQPTSEAGITVTDLAQVVGVDLEVDDAELLAVDDAVAVELPAGALAPGTVTEIGAAESDESGTTTLPVTIAVEWPGREGTQPQDGTSVSVHVEVAAAEDVLAVPVEALLALAEGGYALEVVEVVDGATTRLVAVTIGVFADGLVEVAAAEGSALAAGDTVVVP